MPARPRPDPARDERRAARRSELVEAAVRAVRRDGPGVSMDAIAAEAGVTKPIFYRYFGDRDGLSAALAERFATELMAELRTALLAPGEPRQLLVATIDAYVRFVEREPELYRFLLAGPTAAPATVGPAAAAGQQAVAGFVRQVGQEIAVVLGEQLRAAGADSGAAEPWAYGLIGMVHLAADWWVERRTMPRARLVEYLTTLSWDGMAGSAPLPAPEATPAPAPSRRMPAEPHP